jgi:hypothetical protein
MTQSVPDWTALICEATSAGAGGITPTGKTGRAIERDLEDALDVALAARGRPPVMRKKIPYPYPGWMPQPGPLVLGIYHGDHVLVACELKPHDIDWGLYDLLKVVALFGADKPVHAAYLITGGTENEWKKSGLGANFAPGVRTIGTIDLLRENRKAWLGDLMYINKDGSLESSGRPQTVASKLVLEGFGPYGCDIGGVGDLRVMSVRPAGGPVDVPEELRPTRRV